jgi:integrase
VNIILLDQFYSWARKQKYRNKVISNASLNKCITILKIISKSAIIQYGWGAEYNPFHGYKKLPVEDPYKKVLPFSIDEQIQLINALPDHWKPYFKFAFAGGLRQGEQITIKPDDIDWDQQVLHIRRALTRGEDGKLIEGNTKNKYSLRSIQLLPVMYEALLEQKAIYDQCKSAEYLFCTKVGKRIRPSNLRRNVWTPVLKKTNLAYRDMRQTRHSFATHALSCGENPLWIARILGHRNTEMIIKVYSKYIESNAGSNLEGNRFNSLYGRKVTISNKQ